MLVQDFLTLLDEVSPFSLQASWDNSGLNLGNPQQDVKNIYTTLEIDINQAKNLKPNSLVITHHPLFFSSFKTINTQNYPHNIASILLSKNCSLIAMHTNFDHTHLNHFFASNILGFDNLAKQDFALFTQIRVISFDSLLIRIKKALHTPKLKALKASEKISCVYIVCGSGMSALPFVPSHSQSCLITGDIKHHDAMEAYNLGISLVDVGHFESEIFFAQIMSEILQNFGYEVIMQTFENPLKFY